MYVIDIERWHSSTLAVVGRLDALGVPWTWTPQRARAALRAVAEDAAPLVVLMAQVERSERPRGSYPRGGN